MRNLALFISAAAIISNGCSSSEEDLTTFDVKVTNEYTLPLPVFIEEGIEWVDQLQFSIQIRELIVDGEAVVGIRTIASVENDIMAEKASGTKWHAFQLSHGEHSSNLVPVSLPWESNFFYNWRIPKDWESVEIEYSFHNSGGELIDIYKATYTKSTRVQQDAAGNSG